MSLTYKGKFVVKEDRPGDKKLIIVHKSAEASNLKILKGEEEATVEQMMMTSYMNMGLEQAITTIPKLEYSLKNPPNPKEIDCLGF